MLPAHQHQDDLRPHSRREQAPQPAPTLVAPSRFGPQHVLHMQRTHGNHYVQRMLANRVQRQDEAPEAAVNTSPIQVQGDGGQVEEMEQTTDAGAAAELKAGSNAVNTIIRPNAAPQTTLGGASPSVASDEIPAQTIVAPGGSPTVNAAAGSNDCLPSTNSATLTWSVVSVDGTNWGVQVDSLALAGTIQIKPWPNNPTSMTVPNTPNPVDGGNLNDTAGSDNNWQTAIDDLADYDNATGGGAGLNWHATDASSAHEWAHWNQDYVGDAVASNWPAANADLDALREPKASSADATAARTALEPRVNDRMRTWRRAVIRRWNVLIDTTDKPGSGGRGYAAGMGVLNGYIGRIRAWRLVTSAREAISGAASAVSGFLGNLF